LFGISCLNKAAEHPQKKADTLKSNVPAELKKLISSYPEKLESADENTLYWKDGTAMIFEDGNEPQDFESLLNNADLHDQMSQKYTAGKDWDLPPPVNFEPGRIRNEAFFLKMYGSSSREVQKNLVPVRWVDGTSVMITSVNGVNEKLEAVVNELEQLPAEYKPYLKNIGGSFLWRKIAGTNRLSMHSFGIAIDINTAFSNYWQWEKNVKYKNQIPMEIVEIFEKHGFIWGGKWYHYDTMHFEYRPELLP
jgi:hypothetical protein